MNPCKNRQEGRTWLELWNSGALELWSSGGLWCAFPRFPGSIHGAAGVTSHSTAGVPGSKKGKKNYPKGSKRVNNRQEG